MGQSSSTPTLVQGKNVLITNKTIDVADTLSKDVAYRLDKLNNIIKVFNTNDTDDLLKIVEQYQEVLKTSGKQNIDLNNIKLNIKKFHELVLKSLDNIPYEQRNAKRKEILKNSNLYNILSASLREQIEKEKNELLKDSSITKNPVIMEGINKIFYNIGDIRAKYKYFEHEYININLFLIVFIQHAHHTLTSFMNEIMRITIERDAFHEKSTKDFIDAIINILSKSQLDIKPDEFENFRKMMKNLEYETTINKDKITKLISEASERAHKELLSLPPPPNKTNASSVKPSNELPGTESLSSKPIKSSNDSKPIKSSNDSSLIKSSNESSSSKLIKSSNESKPISPFDNLINMPDLSKKGGFIRDHSILPQTFYSLDKQ
jgi:hypothetical protein